MDAVGPLLTIREVALELRCSPDTIRRRIATGDLPVVQLGGQGKMIRIPARALDRHVRAEHLDGEAA